jgi:hypothetical protein
MVKDMRLDLEDNDYKLTEGAAWFAVKKFAIRIHSTDEGVVVDIFKDPLEGFDEPLASTYAFDSECEEES